MKLYLTEVIDDTALKRLTEACSMTKDLNEAEIVLTRNLKIDRNFIDSAPCLKAIAIHGTGISDVDVDYAKGKGITVFNSPYQNTESVAELNVSLALMAARKIRQINEGERNMQILSGTELYGKKAGFIGFGHIAERTAEILKYGFRMEIVAYNRSRKRVPGIAFLPMDEVLRQADIIFIGTSLNVGTYHLLNKTTLGFIKNGAILVNTARGAIVDEKILAAYLHTGRIACYAADVLENEPLTDSEPLLKENTILLPHVGANTENALYNVGGLITDEILDFIHHKNPKYRL